MESGKKTSWVVGTVLLAVAIAALTWFVLLAPVLDETTAAADDTRTAQDRNTALTTQLTRLEKQFADLDDYRHQLTTIEGQIPATAKTSDFLRTVDALAAAAGTAIVDTTVGTPVDVLPAAPAEGDAAATDPAADPAAEGTGDAAATDQAADDATATAPDVAGAPAIPGFVAIPVSVTALGNPAGVLNFLDALQQQSSRLMLVTDLDGSGQDDADASGGRPATVEGDLELIISGYLYVLADPTVTAPDEQDGTTTAPQPGGDGSGAFSGA